LQTLRRAVRRRQDVPQVLVGHGFGALVVLRYLETQPGEPPAASRDRKPLAGLARAARRLETPGGEAGGPLADVADGTRRRIHDGRRTGELQWAQRAVLADYQRIERRCCSYSARPTR